MVMVILAAASPSSAPGTKRTVASSPRWLLHVSTTYWPYNGPHLLAYTLRSFLLQTISATLIIDLYLSPDVPRTNFFPAPYHCEILHLTVMAAKFHLSSHSSHPIHQTMIRKNSSLTEKKKKKGEHTQRSKRFLLGC